MSKIKVWSYDEDDYIEENSIGKVKYIGENFEDIASDKIYDVISIEEGMLRVVDNEEMGYLYSITNPAPLDMSSKGGIWEIVEDETGELTQKFKEIKLI